MFKSLNISLLIFFTITLGYAQNWKQYPYTPTGTDIIFPEDEGKHFTVPNLEWWYTVINAKGETTGDKYSILVTHFNNQIRFFTIANITKKAHTSATRIGRLISTPGELDLVHRIDNHHDIFRHKKDQKGNLIPFEYIVKTKDSEKGMKLYVELKAIKKPLIVNHTGYVEVGSSGNSWYYSLPRLQAFGSVTYRGLTERIRGLAWVDHQWGPFFVSPVNIGRLFETYEWFCMQLNNGMDIMISNIYDRKYNLPQTLDYGSINISDKNGNLIVVENREFKRTKFWQDPVSKKYMSMGWELNIPQHNIHLTLTPEFKEQMVKFPLKGDFWEGSLSVKGKIDGKDVLGFGFGELIHQFKIPKIRVNWIKSRVSMDEAIEINWRILNHDQGNPLHYSISLTSSLGEIFIKSGFTQSQLLLNFSRFSRLRLSKKTKYRFKITGFSVDKTITGHAYSNYFKFK